MIIVSADSTTVQSILWHAILFLEVCTFWILKHNYEQNYSIVCRDWCSFSTVISLSHAYNMEFAPNNPSAELWFGNIIYYIIKFKIEFSIMLLLSSKLFISYFCTYGYYNLLKNKSLMISWRKNRKLYCINCLLGNYH